MKSYSYETTNSLGIKSTITMPGTVLVRACTCLPEQKHDGRLDPVQYLSVDLYLNSLCAEVRISRYVHGVGTHIHLNPKQALSLLKWLQQEENHLKELDHGDE